jgi:hypothetical protein
MNNDEMPELINDIFDFLKKTDYYSKGEILYLMPYTVKELGIE